MVMDKLVTVLPLIPLLVCHVAWLAVGMYTFAEEPLIPTTPTLSLRSPEHKSHLVSNIYFIIVWIRF